MLVKPCSYDIRKTMETMAPVKSGIPYIQTRDAAFIVWFEDLESVLYLMSLLKVKIMDITVKGKIVSTPTDIYCVEVKCQDLTDESKKKPSIEKICKLLNKISYTTKDLSEEHSATFEFDVLSEPLKEKVRTFVADQTYDGMD